YADTVAGALAVVPAGVSRSNLLFAHIADGPAIAAPWQTGIAFLNTGATAATLDIFALSPTGALIGAATKSVAPGGRLVDQLHNWIPAVNGVNGGFVFVRSSNGAPVYGIELFYTQDLTILSNVASGGLAAGVTYTPPAAVTLSSISPNPAVRGGTITLA